MRRFALIFLLLALAFPALEIYTMFVVADFIGWWLLAWLLASAFTGSALIKQGSRAVFGRMGFAMQSGQSPFAVLWDSGRTILAGLLLIFPGVISDGIALILLLLPSASGRGQARRASNDDHSGDDIIEGEVRVVDVELIETDSKPAAKSR